MGCQQSVDVNTDINTKIRSNKNGLIQIVDMPNDQFHFKIIDQAKELCSFKKLQEAQKIADNFFQNGYILEAIEIYKKIITTDPNYNRDIQGLGCEQLTVSYYQWNVFEWYNKKRQQKKIKSSHYDALSLCFTLFKQKRNKYSNDYKRGLTWYKSMVAAHPENVGLLMGYANMFVNTQSYDQALRHYDRVISLKGDLVNAYASKAMIYEYKRRNFDKANQLALKIKELQKQNPYADFILARNIKQIDEKIARLKQACNIHPQYVRITNEVGICYGATKKDYDQAIEWYIKCINISPKYHSSYNNIGVNNQLKQNFQQAKKWYYKAMEIKFDYNAPYENISDVYIAQKWNDQQIEKEAIQLKNVQFSDFCWMLGVSFQKKRQINRAIYWLQKSIQINPNNFNYWNSLGISLDQNNRCQKAIDAYKRAIEINPQYHISYYNIAISYKTLLKLDECQEYYKKAVEINPKYSFAWNNLGNLYKNKQEYQQAIQYYQRAIEYNSTYTLALANMGLCQLKIGKYKQAFESFNKAKQSLPNDNNNLSQSNKTFLKDQLDKFDKQGQKWRKTGSITDQEKQTLKNLIKLFQTMFKNIAQAAQVIKMPKQKIFNPQIIQIIKIINKDKFELQKIQQIFQLVQKVFHQDQEYFHIIPLLIIEKFSRSVFQKKKSIMQVEAELRDIMKKIAAQVSSKQFSEGENKPLSKIPNLKVTESQITGKEVNLFKKTTYFNSALELYHEINNINTEAKKSYTDFSLLVEETRKKSNGLPGGISTKIPIKQSQQFKVMLRITQKMFKKQINKERTTKIINAINLKLEQQQKPTLDVVVRQIMETWNDQITCILQQRNRNDVQTHFTISDLLRARCLYTSIDDLSKAVRVVDSYCKAQNYDIIELDNRLAKPQTQDVVFKIKIGDAVCELQLAMKQNDLYTHLDHCVYEILRSPLGVIFGSYLFMSKQIKYPFTTNCKDISQNIEEETQNQEMKIVKDCAKFVLQQLQNVNKSKQAIQNPTI